MVSCFVLKRTDTNQYYKGPQVGVRSYAKDERNEWVPELKKAKRYKRFVDASNAAKYKQPSKYYDPEQIHWTNQPGVFVVEEYELQKIGERVV